MKTVVSIISIFVGVTNLNAQSKSDSIIALKNEIKIKQIALAKLENSNNSSEINHQNENLTDEIINDLFEMKVISNKEIVSFSLSNDKFKVNNVLQPQTILQKFITKYKVSKGTAIACSKNKLSSSISINN